MYHHFPVMYSLRAQKNFVLLWQSSKCSKCNYTGWKGAERCVMWGPNRPGLCVLECSDWDRCVLLCLDRAWCLLICPHRTWCVLICPHRTWCLLMSWQDLVRADMSWQGLVRADMSWQGLVRDPVADTEYDFLILVKINISGRSTGGNSPTCQLSIQVRDRYRKVVSFTKSK
jgi:hypothetical protein